jgi:hypothetical protein
MILGSGGSNCSLFAIEARFRERNPRVFGENANRTLKV